MANDIELLAYQRIAETGLSAAELLALPLDEYGRLTGRSLKFQPEPVAEPPAAPQSAAQTPESGPQGVDVASMDMAQYAEFRHAAGIGRSASARGIFGN